MSQAEALLASLAEEVPEHIHSVTDSDTYFIIDPITRTLENTARKKNVIMQYDHESEVLTFEIPRYVEGHDMTLCNRVYAHWNNIGTKTGREDETVEEIADLHELTDLQLNPDNPDMVICSWLIKRQSTQLVGVLSFLIQYACVDDAGNMTYEWHTDFYEDMEVRKGRKNSQVAIAEYTDILEQWYARIFGTADGILAQIDNASTEAQEAIKSEGASQVQTIQQESSTQQSAIEAKGQETLDSIPPDYTEMYRMAEEAMRTKADAIVVDAEGSVISVTNASDDPLQSLRIFGRTEQVKTNGNQLFYADKLYTNTLAGATVTNNGDGSFTISGSGTLTGTYSNHTYDYSHEETLRLLRTGTYTLKTGKVTHPYVYVQLRNSGGNILNITGSTYATSTNVVTQEMLDDPTLYMRIGFYGVDGTTIVPGTIKPMLYIDGDGTWEPYSGGYASPCPEWSQELVSIENPTVMVRGKNLLPQTSIEFTSDVYMPLGFKYPPGKYTFSAVLTSADTDADKSAVLFYDGSEWFDSMFVTRSENGERISYSKYMDKEFDTVRFYAAMTYNTSQGDVCKIVDMQLEMSDAPTEFEPYAGYVLPTKRTLRSLKSLSGGDINDELIYDYPTDTWKYIQRIGDVTLDGTQTYKINHYNLSTEGIYIFEYYPGNIREQEVNVPALSDKLVYAIWGSILNSSRVAKVSVLSSRIAVYLPDQTITTVEAFAAYLTENPIRVQYELKAPIITELTTEEVLAFKALRTNKPNTVVQNGVGAYMIAEYNADTEIFMRENQPGPTDEQINNAVNTYLDTNGVQVPSDDHIRTLIDEALGEIVNGEY